MRSVVLTACVIGLSGTSHGAMLDLAGAHRSGLINGAIFETADSGGGGGLNPFLAVHGAGVERGYNTSGRPLAFDEDARLTRDLALADVPLRSIGGEAFYEFILTINETGSAAKQLLSLDVLRIYTSPAPGRMGADPGSLGLLRYEMGDDQVRIDGAVGSGGANLYVLVPASALGGGPRGEFVYLYSAFGAIEASNAGAEVWSVAVPEPGAAALGATGLMVMARRRRNRLRWS